ncbi:MAG: prolipoprotein diacylglyceryl transferase [Burkholderiaceae bacterium]|jgi:phosphatidylglycerol:prolipoprotein diacylglycerol transferase|nr:prolipoprotein diacylglyceryl transferase [Burkholderiaceae bacterium]
MLIHPMPDPVAFRLGPLAVHWYGLMYLLGFMLFLFFGRLRIRQPHIAQAGWTPKDLDDLLFYGVIGVLVGGRLGEVLFYGPIYYLSHPLQIFAVWKGGMSYHGGAAGVALAVLVYCRRKGRSYLDAMDLTAPMYSFGYAAGRIGNFINAELPGRVADASLPWAMIWPNVDSLPRHPSPIYQALVDGLLVGILLWIYARKPRPRGAVTAAYGLLVGFARFFTEYFRVPDYEVSFAGLTLTAGQLLSIPLILIGIFGLRGAYRATARKSSG